MIEEKLSRILYDAFLINSERPLVEPVDVPTLYSTPKINFMLDFSKMYEGVVTVPVFLYHYYYFFHYMFNRQRKNWLEQFAFNTRDTYLPINHDGDPNTTIVSISDILKRAFNGYIPAIRKDFDYYKEKDYFNLSNLKLIVPLYAHLEDPFTVKTGYSVLERMYGSSGFHLFDLKYKDYEFYFNRSILTCNGKLLFMYAIDINDNSEGITIIPKFYVDSAFMKTKGSLNSVIKNHIIPMVSGQMVHNYSKPAEVVISNLDRFVYKVPDSQRISAKDEQEQVTQFLRNNADNVLLSTLHKTTYSKESEIRLDDNDLREIVCS